MLTIYFSPFGNKNGKTPSEDIISGIAKPGKSILYISPSGRKAEATGKSFFAENEKRDFYSLDRFIEKVLKDKKSPVPAGYLDDKLKFIIVQEILSSNAKYAGLFNRSLGTIGVLTELISDFKYYGYGNDTAKLKSRLAETLGTYDRVYERAIFAVEIFEKYQEKIRELNFADDIDRLKTAAEALPGAKMHYDYLVLDGFFDVPEAQKSIFTGIIKICTHTLVIHYGAENIADLKDVKSDFLEHVQSLGKCAIKMRRSEEKLRLPGACLIHKADSVDEEVKEIACKILEIKQKDPVCKYPEIAVTFPSMFTYMPYIKRIFPKYGIPFSTSVEMPYFSLPGIIPVMLLLRCLLEDFPRRTVVDITSSLNFLAFSKEGRALISSASRKAGIVGGLLQWSELEERLSNEEPVYSETHTGSIQKLKKDLQLLFAAMEKLNKSMPLIEFVVLIRKTLKTLDYTIKNEALSQAFSRLLAGMETLLKVFNGHSNSPAENARLFINILSRAAFREEEESAEAVQVLGIMDTRGLYFRHLFFGGLADGDYPVRPKQELIIPDKIRKELGLVHFQRKIELQKLHFYRLLQAPEEEVYLSYPAQKNEKLVLMSNFLPETTAAKNRSAAHPPTKEEEQQAAGRLLGVPAVSFNNIEFADKKKAAAYINALFSGRSEISVTAIDRYLDCPFMFYLEKILRLEILEEPKFEIESAHIGTILHNVMEGGFSPGKKNNAALKTRLEASIQKELAKTTLHIFWKEHIARRMEILLTGILKEELELFKVYPAVYCLEKKGRFNILDGKAVVKGRIDRVDCDDRRFMVLDYKSGSGARGYFDRTRKGESIQLPLYARMIAAERPDLKVGGFCVYDLKEGRARVVKEDKVSELYENALLTAGNAVTSIFNGDFPKKAEKGGGSCWGCSYAALCKP